MEPSGDCFLLVGETMAMQVRLVVDWQYMILQRATSRSLYMTLVRNQWICTYLFSFHVKISDQNKTAETISLKPLDVNIFHF